MSSAFDRYHNNRTCAHALRLTEWASETGSDGEADFASKAATLLAEIPYFQTHPDHIRLIDSHGDPLRKCIVALVRGTGSEALMFAGHYDVVSVKNYRDLSGLAFSPKPLLNALLADLRGRDLSASEAKALEDLESGDFLPGRGLLDMKGGLAAGITVLEDFAARADRTGNLILVMTPDEEASSQGMRALRSALPGLAQEWGLTIVGAINLDATSDQQTGTEGRSIHLGTIGKLLPFALIIGKPSHASYPFEGVSAHLIAAHILQAIEVNAALCDRGRDDLSPPPICLDGGDFRAGYDVTTPDQVWLAFNWLFHAMTPADLFASFRGAVEQALAEALARFSTQSGLYGQSSQVSTPDAARVLSVSEVISMIIEAEGHDGVLNDLAAAQPKGDNPLAISRALAQQLAARARLTGPTVVIGFGSLHYPHSHTDTSQAADRAFLDAIEAARISTTATTGVEIKYRDYFTGISDMSFLGQAPTAAESRIVAENTVARQYVDTLCDDALRFPAVNIGPWGREYHQRLERIHAPYAFETLPHFLTEIVKKRFG